MSEWISVKDRFPDYFTWVLIVTEKKFIGVARRFNDMDDCPYEWMSEYGEFIDSRWITHWMPLPEPPNT